MCGDQVIITCHVEEGSTAALATQGSTKVFMYTEPRCVCLCVVIPCILEEPKPKRTHVQH